MNEDTMVQDKNNGVVENSTLAGEVANPTLTTPSLDADVAAQIEAVRQKYEKDISQLKSTFQRKESERERELGQRLQQYEAEVERLRVSTMDEDERAQYEQTAVYRRMQQMEEQLAELDNQRTETEAMFKAQQYFLSQGVPPEELILDEGYEALWNTGMYWLTSEFQKLRSGSAQQAQAPQKPAITAPSVVTQTNTPAYTGSTWDDLVKKYGDEETVYRLVETQQLPPSIIPGYKQG